MPLKLSRVTPWLTIERLRTTVLIGGGVLVAAIAVFLGLGQWKLHRLVRDLPKRLGIDIQQQGDEVNYSQSRKGKTIFKLHASKEMQMSNGKVLLHDVRIDLYGEDGQRTDTISGSEFEYDRAASVAQAAGPVEITLIRPDVKPAVSTIVLDGVSSDANTHSLNAPKVAERSVAREVHVKTSGLTFNQKTGVAMTKNRVDFVLEQGSGSSIGATYASSSGQLVLDRDVELHVDRNGDPVTVRAGHADFERNQQLCQMSQAHAQYSGGTVQSANALIHFRPDGSVSQLDGSGGVELQTITGGQMTAPKGTVNFDAQNRPQNGVLEGGAIMELAQPERHIRGSAPIARLQFSGEGQLKKAHLEQGVTFESRQQAVNAAGVVLQLHRTWKSQVADIAFVPARHRGSDTRGGKVPGLPTRGSVSNGGGSSQVEPKSVHGAGGVVVTSESSGASGRDLVTLQADTVEAELGPGGTLSSLNGNGHAHFDQVTVLGVHQSSTSDQLEVTFLEGQDLQDSAGTAAKPASASNSKLDSAKDSQRNSSLSASISSIVQIGNVVLVQDAPPAASQSSGSGRRSSGNVEKRSAQAQTSVRATASRADYDGLSQMLHLTGSPRVRDGELDMTANQIDFSRSSGDAFAHGNVKASWSGSTNGTDTKYQRLPWPGLYFGGASGAGANGDSSRALGPIHAIAEEAELRQATQEVVFRTGGGSHKSDARALNASALKADLPRLWQGGNSVSAPIITLNRLKQTLNAEASGASNPVRTVLVSNGGTPALRGTGQKAVAGESANSSKQSGPSIIRLRSGDLHYSEGERLATLHAGLLPSVTAETSGSGGVATVNSQEAEVKLLPAGVHPAPKASSDKNEAGENSGRTGFRAEIQSEGGSGPRSEAGQPSHSTPNSSIDQLTALRRVTVDWPGRRGTGEKLVYLGEDGTFTLTGTNAVPPRITSQVQGTVTGSALVYHTRDDSVSVEGDGGKTQTDTQAPKHRSKTETQSPK